MSDKYGRTADAIARAFGKPAKKKPEDQEESQTLAERITEGLLSPEERRRRKKARELAQQAAASNEE